MTQDRRIHLDQPAVIADLPRVLAGLTNTPTDGLLLIGRRHLRSNNSWMHNLPRLLGGTNKATLHVHPADAQAHGLGDHDRALLSSAVGSIEVDIEIRDDLMPGVLCLPHGWGHGTRKAGGWQRADREPGASLNDITDRRRYDPLSGNAAVTALPVRLERIKPSTGPALDDLIGSST